MYQQEVRTVQEVHHTNGDHTTTTHHVVSDDEDPIGEKPIQRPVDIEQDMKEMERRKRVEIIMNSQIFREELERIIDSQLNEGYLPASLSALQQVTELLLPNGARNSGSRSLGSTTSIPINDIRGVDAFRYVKGEKNIRCKVAAVYRLVDLYGWSEGIYNHITVRLSQDQEHFLLNPFGLQYHEITASSLLKVDMQGNIVDPGSTSFSFNKAGFILHSAIHAARPDIRAIIHIHHPPCVAVSAMKCGLLMVSQESALVGDVSYHDYRGLVLDPKERDEIAKNLGLHNKVLILRNHGMVTCGESLEEALFLMHNLVSACESQIKLLPIGLDNISIMSDEAVQQVRSVVKTSGTQVQGKPDQDPSSPVKGDYLDRVKKWKVWDLEFEAQMRMLDNAGFRTGYLYRQPLLRVDQQPRSKYDVEIPPAALSHANQYLEEDKWLSPLKKLVDGKKTQDKMRWVNSPNVYQRVEIQESGTPDPKKITKWVNDGSPSHASNPIKIETAHQFVPVNVDPSEFRRKQREMKAVRMQNTITSGPQSNILDGATWDETKRTTETVVDGNVTRSTDTTVMVGAASKGIIQREFQHNATVYKSAYSKNPFDNVTAQEIEEYKQYVLKKERGEPVDELPEHVRHLLLEPVSGSDPSRNPRQVTSPKSPLQSPMSDPEAQSSRTVINGDKKGKGGVTIVVTSPKVSRSSASVHRSHSARMAAQAAEDSYFARRFRSERRAKNPTKKSTSDTNVGGGGDMSGASRSSKEDLSTSEKSKKDKKGKGFRTPSFLKKKKKSKDEKQ